MPPKIAAIEMKNVHKNEIHFNRQTPFVDFSGPLSAVRPAMLHRLSPSFLPTAIRHSRSSCKRLRKEPQVVKIHHES